MILRLIEQTLKLDLFQGKVVIVSGPRQVGKTTLMEGLRRSIPEKSLWLNCDEPDIRFLLEQVTSTQLRELIGDYRLVFIDEAQRVKNIGLTLKLLADNLKDVQVIATGSSAFELADKINEPLTGRKRAYSLFPLSTEEMVQHTSILEEGRLLERRLIYGFYPEVIRHPAAAERTLLEISDNYLYKDLLALETIRKPAFLDKIITALALQIGHEVSFTELAQLTGADHKTVEHYVRMLEQCYVIFTLGTFSRNLRNEIRKSRKIYFYDNGIRNAIIKNFNPLALRQDSGALWENYLMSERKKTLAYNNRMANTYFWRTHAQQEIDYIEEAGGALSAYEFKWSRNTRVKLPEAFRKAYPETKFSVIDRSNYLSFVCSSAASKSEPA